METVTNLRKIFTTQGIKGAGKWKRMDFDSAIINAEFAAYAQSEAMEAAKQTKPKKGICEDCGRKVGKSGHPTLCPACYEYAQWENTHTDEGHEAVADSTSEEIELMTGCPVCHPELDPRKAPHGERKGTSRAGMVIVAKGSEVHKSNVFKVAAEAAGWTVKVMDTFDETEGDGPARYYADAHRGDDAIQLAWDGRAYDYPSSSARINGKDRKVRNLKEALRLL